MQVYMCIRCSPRAMARIECCEQRSEELEAGEHEEEKDGGVSGGDYDDD